MDRSVNWWMPLEHRGGLHTGFQGLMEVPFLLPSSSGKQSHGSLLLLSLEPWLSGSMETVMFTQGNLRLNSLTAGHQKEVAELLIAPSACHLPAVEAHLQTLFWRHLTPWKLCKAKVSAHILKHRHTALTVTWKRHCVGHTRGSPRSTCLRGCLSDMPAPAPFGGQEGVWLTLKRTSPNATRGHVFA